MNWTKESENLYTAFGGYSIEKRVGHWMTYTPESEYPVYVSPNDPSDLYLEEAKEAAETA